MKRASYTRKALLIISDGGDNSSRYDDREITDLVKESDVLIYSIGIYEEYFQSEEERRGPLLLSDISELTGGRLLTVNNPKDLTDVALRIGAELRSKRAWLPSQDANSRWQVAQDQGQITESERSSTSSDQRQRGVLCPYALTKLRQQYYSACLTWSDESSSGTQ